MSDTTSSFSQKGCCKFCSKPTRSIATSLCNWCWELKTRIASNIQVAEKVIQELKK